MAQLKSCCIYRSKRPSPESGAASYSFNILVSHGVASRLDRSVRFLFARVPTIIAAGPLDECPDVLRGAGPHVLPRTTPVLLYTKVYPRACYM